LHYALIVSPSPFVEWLLDKNVDIFNKNTDGQTAGEFGTEWIKETNKRIGNAYELQVRLRHSDTPLWFKKIQAELDTENCPADDEYRLLFKPENLDCACAEQRQALLQRRSNVIHKMEILKSAQRARLR
jgi:hypothetical protein